MGPINRAPFPALAAPPVHGLAHQISNNCWVRSITIMSGINSIPSSVVQQIFPNMSIEKIFVYKAAFSIALAGGYSYLRLALILVRG